MSLSELFKPWLGSCGACAAPWPNVALVLQYLQALRVSSDTFKKRKKKTKARKKEYSKEEKNIHFYLFCLGVLLLDPGSRTAL